MYLRVPGREGGGGTRIHIHTGGHWLQYHERWGGHTLARHVGHTDAQLLTRLQQSARIRGASTFFDQETAESLMSQTIRQNRARIQQWLRSGCDDALVLEYTGRSVIGRGLSRGEQAVHPMTDARVLLRRALHKKYYVHTAYPE